MNEIVSRINIGQRFDLGEGEELKAFTTAGFLGSEYGPFNVPFPEQAADAVRPPAGMSPGHTTERIYGLIKAQIMSGERGEGRGEARSHGGGRAA